MTNKSNEEGNDLNKNGLSNQNKNLSPTLSSFSEGFIALDENYQIVYCSKELIQLLEKNSEQIINHNFWTLAKSNESLSWLLNYRDDIRENETSLVSKHFESINKWLEAKIICTEGRISIYVKDITNSKIAATLNKDDRMFRQMYDLSPVPQFVYESETLKFLHVNESAKSFYGYTEEDFMGMTIKNIRPKPDVIILDNILNTIKPGVFSQTIVNHQLKNGEIRKVKIESNSILFKEKNARLVMVLDLTVQILAQEAILKSEHRFKCLAENGSDLIAILDQEMNYKYVNESSMAILNHDPAELTGKNAFNYIHPDDKESIISELSTLKAHQQIKLSPFRFIDGKNRYRWIETTLTDMTHESNINGIIANSRDITETILNKLKIQKSINRYEIVSKATSDAIWDYDISTKKITWNKGIKGIFGHKKIGYTLDWFIAHIHPNDLSESIIQEYTKTLNDGKARLTRQYRFRCADGTYKTVLDRSFIIYDALKNPVRMIGSMQDITHKIEYVNAIEEQNKKLQEINWLQSHAVRAPLARILGIIQLINDVSITEEEKPQLLSYLNTSAEELDSVIKNIIKTAR